MSSPRQVTARQRWVLHFTHIDNLPAMASSGRLMCDAAARGEHLRVEVGDIAIKDSRRHRKLLSDHADA